MLTTIVDTPLANIRIGANVKRAGRRPPTRSCRSSSLRT